MKEDRLMLASESPQLPTAHLPVAATSTPAPCEITPEERARLVRLCLRYTRDSDAAEDLAQETLVEAWRGWHKLRDAGDPAARANWLAAIATNVCRRWARRQGREAARVIAIDANSIVETQVDGFGSHDWLAHGSDLAADVEDELERAELQILVEKALALLPPETRDLLLARYLLEQSPSEIAAGHGLSEATLAVRLHRARQALRKLLSTTMRAEAVAFGLVDGEEVGMGWQETRIWCPLCGLAKLRGQLDQAAQLLALRCPGCFDTHPDVLNHMNTVGLLDGVKTFKAAFNRVMSWADPYYRRGVERREVICHKCKRPAPLLPGLPPDTPPPSRAESALHVACSCQAVNFTELSGMALYTPEGRRFWREHPRIRLAHPWQVETGGREAIVVGYESVTGSARLDTLFARDSLELLAIHGALGA
jgi:RNA polymerase sigma-70 factor (ECF subfamily)